MSERTCVSCGNPVPTHFKFCGFCGSVQQAAPAPVAAEVAPEPAWAKLILIKGEEVEGNTYPIRAEQLLIGRSSGDIRFTEDLHISPQHARFRHDGDQIIVEDLGSVNGVYYKLGKPVEVEDGDFIICGEQVLQFRVPKTDLRLVGEHGTYFYGSPMPQVYFQISQVLPGGREGAIYAARRRVITVGREDCDLNFPSDRFMSRYHTKFEVQKGKYLLYDLESRNGTFLRITREHALEHGDCFFVGRQLMRADLQ